MPPESLLIAETRQKKKPPLYSPSYQTTAHARARPRSRHDPFTPTNQVHKNFSKTTSTPPPSPPRLLRKHLNASHSVVKRASVTMAGCARCRKLCVRTLTFSRKTTPCLVTFSRFWINMLVNSRVQVLPSASLGAPLPFAASGSQISDSRQHRTTNPISASSVRPIHV